MSNLHTQMLLLGAFAVLALVLASVGLYGVLSYRVAQRTPEIGLRLALGASRRDGDGSIVRRALRLALPGLALGLIGASILTGVLSSRRFGTSPTDSLTFDDA